MSFLGLYRDPTVAVVTSACDWRIAGLVEGERPVSLYLVVPPSDISRTQPLVRLILNQIGRRLTERLEGTNGAPRRQLLLMLDEFPALGRLDFFETALAFLAGYGVRAFLIALTVLAMAVAPMLVARTIGVESAQSSSAYAAVAAAPMQQDDDGDEVAPGRKEVAADGDQVHRPGDGASERYQEPEARAGVAQAGGVVGEEPRGLDLGAHFGQLELDGLELGDGLAERLALLRIPERVLERALGHPHHLGPDADAALVQRLDGDLVALAHLAQDVVLGHAHALQDQLAGG